MADFPESTDALLLAAKIVQPVRVKRKSSIDNKYTRLFGYFSLNILLGAIFVGFLSGGSRAALLAVINGAISEANEAHYLYYFIGLSAVLLVSQTASRVLLTKLSQQLMIKLRIKLCNEILKAPLRNIEETGDSKLFSALKDDVASISGALMSLPILAIHFSTIVVSMLYLGYLSLNLLFSFLCALIVGAVIYQLIVSSGSKFFQKAREDQNDLTECFRTVIAGNKELKMNSERSKHYLEKSLLPIATSFKENSISANKIYTIATTWGQFIFFSYIGIMLFYISSADNINRDVLTGSVLAVLYIIIPLELLLTAVPLFVRARIAAGNINKIGLSLTLNDDESNVVTSVFEESKSSCLSLRDIKHSYETEQSGFTLGPIDISFFPGELTFIMGGNGSGKSTLLKIMTGLYVPQSGEITYKKVLVNDLNRASYRQNFSVIFSEFHLFAELEGLKIDQRRDKAVELLKTLQIDHCVEIVDGAFSNTDLSTGQKKRVALLISYLEDRTIYIYDEWAADQDPAFKHYFYTVLLPELSTPEKIIIVITHDDRYIDVADRVIHLENGKIIKDNRKTVGVNIK